MAQTHSEIGRVSRKVSSDRQPEPGSWDLPRGAGGCPRCSCGVVGQGERRAPFGRVLLRLWAAPQGSGARGLARTPKSVAERQLRDADDGQKQTARRQHELCRCAPWPLRSRTSPFPMGPCSPITEPRCRGDLLFPLRNPCSPPGERGHRGRKRTLCQERVPWRT
jgi:hypothetical protein